MCRLERADLQIRFIIGSYPLYGKNRGITNNQRNQLASLVDSFAICKEQRSVEERLF